MEARLLVALGPWVNDKESSAVGPFSLFFVRVVADDEEFVRWTSLRPRTARDSLTLDHRMSFGGNVKRVSALSGA